MESEGYKVRWEAARRNITYTTPSGWQCRDHLLFGEKYLKENMEYEFRIREEVIYGRAVGEEPTCADGTGHTADAASRSASHESRVGGSDERPLHAGVPHRETDWLSQESQRIAGAAPAQTQMDELLKAVKHLEQMSEQAGKRNEKCFSLSGIRLPRLRLPHLDGPTWAVLLMGTAALLLLWWGLDTVWSSLSLLLQ